VAAVDGGVEAAPWQPGRGTESILLAEDDESVRRFVEAVLEAAGYTVYAAESGVAALERLESLHAPPDLLLTDVIMPGMDGRVLAQEVIRRAPGIRLVFMSGYAEVTADLPGPQSFDFRLIKKPFTAEELLKKVREILERRD
jgi:CheY-like chemotaxis protein